MHLLWHLELLPEHRFLPDSHQVYRRNNQSWQVHRENVCKIILADLLFGCAPNYPDSTQTTHDLKNEGESCYCY